MKFTKPFDDKDCYVEIYDNSETQTFDVSGVDVFGRPIELSYDRWSEATSHFYFELCYMLNKEVMLKTADQRIPTLDLHE